MQPKDMLREIDLRKLFSSLFPGIAPADAGLVPCPFHADRNPSLNPHYEAPDGKPRFHCFGCGIGGDALDLVREAARLDGEELSFPEALCRLSELAGVPVEIGPLSESCRAQRLHREWLKRVAGYFKNCLKSHAAGERARSWLIERGIPPETWERLPIGIYPPWEEIKAWAGEQGIPQEWLKKERLLIGAAQSGQKWTGSLAFFYGLSFKEIGRIKLRIPREKGPESMTWLGEKGTEIGFFGLSSYDPREGDGRALLVEGEFDLLLPWALAVREKGLIPPIFCRSGGAAKADRTYKILASLSVRTLYALPDNDESGLQWAERAIRGAEAAGLPVLISWPEDYRPGEDPADLCLRLSSIEAFRQAIANAFLPWQWMARRILADSDGSPEGIQEARLKALAYAKKLKGTARRDFLAGVTPATGAPFQDLLEELETARRFQTSPPSELLLESARELLGAISSADHIQLTLQNPEALGAVALVAGQDRGAYEAALLRLREGGVREREIRALEKAVGAERRKRIGMRLTTPGEEPPAPPSIRDLLPGAPVSENLVAPGGWHISSMGIARVVIAQEAGIAHQPIAPAPILIASRLHDGAEKTEALVLAWERDGRWRHHAVDRAVVASAREIVSLARQGLPVTSGTARALVDYLADFEAINLPYLPKTCVSHQMGWQGPGGEQGFLWGRTLIGPDGSFTEQAGLEELASEAFQKGKIAFYGADAGEEQIADGFHAQGSFGEWKLSAYLVSSYPRVMLSLYAALAPPLLVVLDTPNFIIDWSFVTSTGKTTCLRLSASCWGNPDERKPAAAMGSWDATRVWVERASVVLNSLPLILDDTKRARRPQDVAQVLYDVASGRGRGRGSPGGMRQAGSWKTILLSSGEAPIDSFTQDGGTRARVIKVWGPPFGRADRDTVSVVRELNLAVRQHYGHAGPRFVQFLLRNQSRWERWREEFFALQKEYSERAGGNPVADRLVEHFAVLTMAARLAHQALELPWECQDPVASLWEDLIEEISEADRALHALAYVVSWAKSNAHAFWGRHQIGGDGNPKIPFQGWAGKWDKGEDWEFIAFYPHKLRSLLIEFGFEPDPILRLWQDQNWLEIDKSAGRYQKWISIDGQGERSHAIGRKAVSLVY